VFRVLSSFLLALRGGFLLDGCALRLLRGGIGALTFNLCFFLFPLSVLAFLFRLFLSLLGGYPMCFRIFPRSLFRRETCTRFFGKVARECFVSFCFRERVDRRACRYDRKQRNQ